jgi:heme oxygenase
LASVEQLETGSETVVRGTSVLSAVRAATRAAHVRIEQSQTMLRLVSGDYTQAEYVAHLSDLLGFYEPLEAMLRAIDIGAAGSETAFPLHKSELIERDLRDLGLTTSQMRILPRCRDLPAIAATTGVLGSLYVYEGAALGGQIISRCLSRSLGASLIFAFYHSDASRTEQRWNAFCRRLEMVDASAGAAICESASRVFETFATWIERRQSPNLTAWRPNLTAGAPT